VALGRFNRLPSVETILDTTDTFQEPCDGTKDAAFMDFVDFFPGTTRPVAGLTTEGNTAREEGDSAFTSFVGDGELELVVWNTEFGVFPM